MRVFGVTFQQQVQAQTRQEKWYREQQKIKQQPTAVPGIQGQQGRVEGQKTRQRRRGASLSVEPLQQGYV